MGLFGFGLQLITQPSTVRTERRLNDAGTAHSGESQMLCNQQVAGSSPAASSHQNANLGRRLSPARAGISAYADLAEGSGDA